MKRLHMGCGESLQAHMPIASPPKRGLWSLLRGRLFCLGAMLPGAKRIHSRGR